MSLSKDCHAELHILVMRAVGEPDDSRIRKCTDDMIAVCLKHNYASVQTIHPKAVGVHPKNRDGEGLLLGRAVSRGEKILSVGFSWKVVALDAICFEDHPGHRQIADFTMDQCAANPGMAQYVRHEVKFGPVGATHCNHWLAMVGDESPCTSPTLSEDGKMSQRKVFVDKDAKHAVEHGLKWVAISYLVEEAFPAIPTIIQRALNASSQMGEGDYTPSFCFVFLY